MKTNTATQTNPSYTPGPWTAQGHEIYSDTRYVGYAYDWSSPNCDPEYGKINDELRVEGESNARLISCAPDLVRVLELMLREFGYTDPTSTEASVLHQARDVLARAKGVARE